jgi:hypothetical protein
MKKVFSRYHIDWSQHAQYQVDHLISVGVGGSNAISNLWPQPLAGKYGARAKAKSDEKLRSLVCSGRSSLPDARHAELVNWYTAPAKLLSLPKPVTKPTLPATPTTPAPSPTSGTPTPTPTPVTPTTVPPTPGATTPAPPTTTPPTTTPPTTTPPATTFDHGTFVVGVDIAPGTYMGVPNQLCTWSRYSDSAATMVVGTGQSTRPIVTISQSDGAFSTTCDGWTVATSPNNGPLMSFGDGTYRIGNDVDLTPGVYQAMGNAALDNSCTWSTWSDLSGSPDSLIASSSGNDPTPTLALDGAVQVVTVYNCGSWQPQSFG